MANAGQELLKRISRLFWASGLRFTVLHVLLRYVRCCTMWHGARCMFHIHQIKVAPCISVLLRGAAVLTYAFRSLTGASEATMLPDEARTVQELLSPSWSSNESNRARCHTADPTNPHNAPSEACCHHRPSSPTIVISCSSFERAFFKSAKAGFQKTTLPPQLNHLGRRLFKGWFLAYIRRLPPVNISLLFLILSSFLCCSVV